MTNIFISYRREDCPAHAGRLYDTLKALFGEQNVFMDVDTIGLGEDFVETIQQAVGACDVVLVLIGDEWLNVKDRAGTRRIDSPEDFVRLEVATALARDDVRVIPVLVEGAEMPNSTQLPEALAPLARRNGISLMDAQWRAGTSILVQAIEPAVARPQASAPRDAPARPGADVPGLPATASSRSATVMWMIPALFGLAGASLIFAGTKTRERRWLTAGIVYL
nr:toll/interleukin-1 receptor domain-containing protein [Solirubrobacterales bacterium]